MHTMAAVALVLAGCSKKDDGVALASAGPGAPPGGAIAPLTVSSTAFAAGGAMPARYTCEGANVSPPLAWTAPPAATRSLAVIVDDPDAPDPRAPKTVFVHWVLYDLPAPTRSLAEGYAAAAGARDGNNDFGQTGFRGPCPPIGRHRYFHKVYALDAVLPDLGQPTKADLERAMDGHVLAKGELVGTYEKGQK